MSIFPVYLPSWYGKGDPNHALCRMFVEFTRCVRCEGRCAWKSAWGHHSVPWGYGDVWCSKKCLNTKKGTGA